MRMVKDYLWFPISWVVRAWNAGKDTRIYAHFIRHAHTSEHDEWQLIGSYFFRQFLHFCATGSSCIFVQKWCSCTFVQHAVYMQCLHFCETCSSYAVLALLWNMQFICSACTFVKHAVHMQCLHFCETCSLYAVLALLWNMQFICSACTFVKHAVHMQCLHFCETCSSHAVLALLWNMQFTCSACTFVKHAVHMQCLHFCETCSSHAVLALLWNMQFTCSACTFVKHAVHMQCLHFCETCSSCTTCSSCIFAQHAFKEEGTGVWVCVCKNCFGFSFCMMVKSEILIFVYITAAVLQGALGNFAWSCLFDQTVEFCSKNVFNHGSFLTHVGLKKKKKKFF